MAKQKQERPAPERFPESSGPAHIVEVTLEKLNLRQIIGSASAPYLNQLASEGVLFTNFDALAHPSQPDYLALFSGSTQGVRRKRDSPVGTDGGDACQRAGRQGSHFRGLRRNRGRSQPYALGGFQFGGRRAEFLVLPDHRSRVCQPADGFVYHAQQRGQHDADQRNRRRRDRGGRHLARANLSAYAAWAQADNSMLIVTFDENDNSVTTTWPNQIATVVVGAGVPAGVDNAQAGNQYALLNTIEVLWADPRRRKRCCAGSRSLFGHAVDGYVDVRHSRPRPHRFLQLSPQNALAVGPNYVVASETLNIQWTNRSDNQQPRKTYTRYSRTRRIIA